MVAIVIPTYNERENLPRLLDGLFALELVDTKVIVVDDASPDGTAEIARKAPGVTVIERVGERGLGSALIRGFRQALADGAEVIVEMDADGSHDPAEVPKLLDAVASGADAAVGSRRIAGGRIIGWGVARHAMSFMAMTAARLVLRLRTRDVTNGFRAYRRAVLEKIGLATIRSNGYAFQEEMLFRAERAGFRVVEVPTIFRDRTMGKSKLSLGDVGEFFVSLIRLWRSR